MTRMLTPGREAFTHLLVAAQRSRSIAAENDSLDLFGDQEIGGITIPGLDPVLAETRHLDLLADLAAGTRTCDQTLWMNLAYLVSRSPSWQMSLAIRGVRMPEGEEILDSLKDFAAPTTA